MVGENKGAFKVSDVESTAGMQKYLDLLEMNEEGFALKEAMKDNDFNNKSVVMIQWAALWSDLSDPFHEGSEALEGKEAGYVVNKNTRFSVCLSALLSYFKEPHRVMTSDYRTTKYWWPPKGQGEDPAAGSAED